MAQSTMTRTTITQTIGKSFKDIFSATVLLFVLKVALISLAITASILWLVGGSLTLFIGSYLSVLPLEWLNTTGLSVQEYQDNRVTVPWEFLKTTASSVLSIAISYMIFIIMISIVTSFMIEPLLIKLAQKHYPNAKVVGSPNITISLFLSLKAAIILLFIFMFTFPVMFIPLVGAVYMLWLWSILLKKPTIYDVSSLFLTTKKEVKAKTKKSTMLAMIAAGFNYIPILNLFAAVFAQILFLHHILGEDNA